MAETKILLIAGTSILHPNNHRIQHMAAQLRAWGYHFDVIGHMNFYIGPTASRWKRFLEGFRQILRNPANIAKNREGIHITVRSLPGLFPNLFQTIWTYFIARRFLERRYKACIFGGPNNGLLAQFLKRNGTIKTLIYDDWDYFPADITSVTNWYGSMTMAWKEKICTRNADVVVSVSHELAELRKSQGAKQTLVVSNGVNYGRFQAAQTRKPHAPTLIYMGHLYSSWGADLPIRALPAIRAKIPAIRYVVLGGGPEMGNLQALAEKMELQDCIEFLGEHGSQEMPRYLAEADIGVITCRDVPFRKYASPLKIYEYMAAGLPIIGTRVGDGAKVIERSKSGIIIDHSAQSFAQAAIELLTDPLRYERCSKNAVNCAKGYDWEEVLSPVHTLLQGLFAENHG